ncbi:MAG: cytochrome c oxidase subunit 4 [Actinomycetota bacterium]|nr:cytochrome c oxidase subunit 4 [Actinomycetota bacterium]
MTDRPEGVRDDAGRTDDSPGFDIQARMFTGIGVFLFLISIVYGFISKEPAGTTMLVLAGGLATLTAAYLGLHKPPPGTDVGEAADPAVDHMDEPWFPHASIWPFAIGAGAVLVANGILLGLWMMLPAGFVLAGAIVGFSRQSRQRA